jgi:transposase-like protein
MSKGIRFTDEFKQDAVAQVVERGYAVSEVAERLTNEIASVADKLFMRDLYGAD